MFLSLSSRGSFIFHGPIMPPITLFIYSISEKYFFRKGSPTFFRNSLHIRPSTINGNTNPLRTIAYNICNYILYGPVDCSFQYRLFSIMQQYTRYDGVCRSIVVNGRSDYLNKIGWEYNYGSDRLLLINRVLYRVYSRVQEIVRRRDACNFIQWIFFQKYKLLSTRV